MIGLSVDAPILRGGEGSRQPMGSVLLTFRMHLNGGAHEI